MGGRSRWRETLLWQELDSREEASAEQLRTILAEVLPDAEQVLDSSSGPSNFTLHDSDHAWRVADRMATIVQAEEGLLAELGPHDLAMLLLSAYLHDIGMAPSLSRIREHYDFLLTGETGVLSPDDRECLQAWLDDEWGGKVPPLITGTPSSDDLRLARQIIASYVRYRHNDWSAEWITERLAPFAGREYPGWAEDVVLLCRSHHFSIDQLKGASFDPRLVGNPGTVLHLRYCACVLRVADVLDFDPERTPLILFAHRAVDERSAIFWHKDHELGFDQTGGAISIHAQPRDAVTHYAINLTIEDVERELVGSRRLADETQFHRMSGRDQDLPHRWELETSVRAKVVPREGAYEYIDGTFRPDTSRLLELVGGVELYGSPMAAVRELLQNAFDAVRDQIARQRLRQEDPASNEVRDLLARTHSVSLTLEMDGSQLRLRCRDTGSGMSREIVKSRFLVGGKKANHEMRSLERLCEEHGFSTGKTARFGIGVLSYFLIASRMEIQTRRSIEANDPDGIGWNFKIAGLEDFGELKRAPRAQVGTEVILTIRDDLLRDGIDRFAKQLRAYLNTTIKRVPCRFSFSASGLPVDAFESDLGWVDREVEVRRKIARLPVYMGEVQGPKDELLSTEARESRAKSSEYWDQIQREILQTLVLEEHQGELPENLGFWRAFSCRFQIAGNPAAAFFRLVDDEKGPEVEILEEFHGLLPSGPLKMAWNGMLLEPDARRNLSRNTFGAVVEVDWCNDVAGRLAVSRNSFSLSDAAMNAWRAVQHELAEIHQSFVERAESSPFHLLNARALGVSTGPQGSKHWLQTGGTEGSSRFLLPLKTPIVDPQVPVRLLGDSTLFWRGSEVLQAPAVTLNSGRYLKKELRWHERDTSPGYVAALRLRGHLVIVPVWDRLDRISPPNQHSPHGYGVKFPEEWKSLTGALCGARSGSGAFLVWNDAHPLVRACTLESWQWAKETLSRTRDLLALRKEAEEQPARVAASLLFLLQKQDQPIWEGLIDRNPSFLSELWEKVDGLVELKEILFWRDSGAGGELIIASPSAWQVLNGWAQGEAISQRLPWPGSEWRLEMSVSNQEDQDRQPDTSADAGDQS